MVGEVLVDLESPGEVQAEAQKGVARDKEAVVEGLTRGK